MILNLRRGLLHSTLCTHKTQSRLRGPSRAVGACLVLPHGFKFDVFLSTSSNGEPSFKAPACCGSFPAAKRTCSVPYLHARLLSACIHLVDPRDCGVQREYRHTQSSIHRENLWGGRVGDQSVSPSVIRRRSLSTSNPCVSCSRFGTCRVRRTLRLRT